MPSHLEKAMMPAKALRRICRRHIGQALARLRKPAHPAAIHGARKEIKRLRSIFRLVQKEMSRRDYRKAGKALHQTADRLAAPRDARVTLKAFEKLAGPDAPLRFPKIQTMLQKHYRRETRRFRNDNSVESAKNVLKKVNRHVRGLKIKPAGWTAIAPGLKQSYRLGQQACKRVRRQSSPENFHEWRKHVKTFWHQLRALCPERPAARAMMDGLERLGEKLGEDHDLFLLKQFVGENCAAQVAEAKALNQRIESRQKILRAAALKFGALLYTETPAMVCARLKNHWNAWPRKAGRR